MKRILLLVAAFMLVFALACTKPAESGETSANAQTDAFHEGDEVPEQVDFWGIEEYRDFAASVDLEDAEFQKFIRSKSYHLNGVSTKADAENVLTVMDSVPTPIIEGFAFWRSNLRFDLDTVVVFFNDGDHYLGFDFTLTPSDETAEDKAGAFKDGAVIMDASDLPELKYLVRPNDNRDSSGVTSYYFTNIHSHCVRLITNLSEEELITTLRGCRYTTFSEYAEKYR